MPFGGGGGGQLPAHVHDNTPLQGGPLNFNNTTIAGMGAGDITFSDGAALQTLGYPAVPAGETLTATALSTAPSWVAAGGAVVSVQNASITNGSTTTSAVFSDVPGSSLTLPTRTGGQAFLSACFMFNNSAANANIKLGIFHGGSLQEVQTLRCYDAFNEHAVSVTATQPLDGSLVKLQYAVNGGITAMVINAATNTSSFQSFEVS